MRVLVAVGLLGLGALAGPVAAQTQGPERINPLIPLLEQRLPIFGVTHPGIGGGRSGGELPDLAEVARETLAYRLSDYQYNSYSPASAERFRGYMEAIVAAGGSVRTHAFISKVPIFHRDPEAAAARVAEQLGQGHVGIWMQEVESAEEVRQAIAAMRLRSRGGLRPDDDLGVAPAYWGLSEAEYRDRAGVWPLDPRGELLVFVIIESVRGVENAREIAAVPGVALVTVGAGTLGGVFTTTTPEGQRMRDQAGFDAAVARVLAACQEFEVACSYPANNPAEVESLMARGFSVFTMQRRDQAAFDAVLAGRRLAGRPLGP